MLLRLAGGSHCACDRVLHWPGGMYPTSGKPLIYFSALFMLFLVKKVQSLKSTDYLLQEIPCAFPVLFVLFCFICGSFGLFVSIFGHLAVYFSCTFFLLSLLFYWKAQKSTEKGRK